MTSPDIVLIMTDEERAVPSYEADEIRRWRSNELVGREWFRDHAVAFERHYTGSLACVPSRPTMFTGQFPDVHGVTQTDGIAKRADDPAMHWLEPFDIPTLGNWFQEAGYDTRYEGKWHISHADLIDPDTGSPLATNTDDGEVITEAVDAYLAANPLSAFGFDGWIGPEPHGARLSDSGLIRDPLVASRAVAWLEDRYARRAAGDEDACRPFLLVVSLVNPHDIVLFPGWMQNNPLPSWEFDVPHVPPAPTADEDLAVKPSVQAAYRDGYPSAYGVRDVVAGAYREFAQRYRDLYYSLHGIVDAPLDAVRRAVCAGGDSTVLVRTSDHGELLGSHGGLHQKWFTAYDEATRVPFEVVDLRRGDPTPRSITDMATSHVDLVPTLLDLAGIDVSAVRGRLGERFDRTPEFPGRSLASVVDGGPADSDRAVYLMTRDNVFEGQFRASIVARMLGQEAHPPLELQTQPPAAMASNLEAIVARVSATATGGTAGWFKLVRVFDDPKSWTEPGVRHLITETESGPVYRSAVMADEWELYHLDSDPIEAVNLWSDERWSDVQATLIRQLEAASTVPRSSARLRGTNAESG